MLATALILTAFMLPSAGQQKTAVPMASQVRPISVRPIPDEAVRRNARLAGNLSPSAKSKVESAAAALAAAAKQQPAMSAAQLQSSARASVIRAFPNLQGMDIEAVVFLVVMKCTQDEESDLKQMMNAMQKNDAAKQGVRSAQTNSANQVSDMSDMDSMRLQMLMDRRSKLLDAMSNVMKSTSDTQSAIIGNLK